MDKVILQTTSNSTGGKEKTKALVSMTPRMTRTWECREQEHGIWGRKRCSNALRPRQNGRHFADDTFKHIFLNENVGISIKISLKFVHKGPINNIPALVQIMAWRRSGDKPMSEPMMVNLLTHISVTRPQWGNKALGNPTFTQPNTQPFKGYSSKCTSIYGLKP